MMNTIRHENTLQKVQVVGLGQACVDVLGSIPLFPREDEKLELTDLAIHCGGPASSALVTLSRLGIQTSFLGSISDDLMGVKILRNLEDQHIETSLLKVTPGYTSQFAFIAISKRQGKRTIFWHRGSVPHLTAEDVDLGIFPHARILHLDGLMIDASIEAARQAKAHNMTVVLDAGSLRPGSRELISWVDVLIASETFAQPLTGPSVEQEEALAVLKGMGPSQAVITLGERGSIGLDDRSFIRQEAYPVRVVDTTGAGDVYHGAYIYGLLMNWDMAQCMRFASAAAALKCTKIGAQRGIPDLDSVNRLLQI